MRVILIGGPSNSGKTSVAQVLAKQLGWHQASTDKLARHPGRPWTPDERPLPPHVVEHYASFTIEELFERVVNHYRNMWPDIEALVTRHSMDDSIDRLILEGSAIWPDMVVTLKLPNVAAVWLQPGEELLRTRIYKASRFAERAESRQEMITKFLGRECLYNQRMIEAVKRFGLKTVEVGPTSSVEDSAKRCLDVIGYERT